MPCRTVHPSAVIAAFFIQNYQEPTADFKSERARVHSTLSDSDSIAHRICKKVRLPKPCSWSTWIHGYSGKVMHRDCSVWSPLPVLRQALVWTLQRTIRNTGDNLAFILHSELITSWKAGRGDYSTMWLLFDDKSTKFPASSVCFRPGYFTAFATGSAFFVFLDRHLLGATVSFFHLHTWLTNSTMSSSSSPFNRATLVCFFHEKRLITGCCGPFLSSGITSEVYGLTKLNRLFTTRTNCFSLEASCTFHSSFGLLHWRCAAPCSWKTDGWKGCRPSSSGHGYLKKLDEQPLSSFYCAMVIWMPSSRRSAWE